jgi:hypothetical protein
LVDVELVCTMLALDVGPRLQPLVQRHADIPSACTGRLGHSHQENRTVSVVVQSIANKKPAEAGFLNFPSLRNFWFSD